MPTFDYAPAPESRSVVSIADSYGLFIDGEFRPGTGGTFPTINPATEETLAQVSEASAAEASLTWASVSSVAGLIVGKVPPVLAWNSPSMNRP